MYIVSTSLSFQGECDRLTYSVQTLESELSERTAHCEELEKQHNEEAENCRLIEVCTLNMLNCVLPNACTCIPDIPRLVYANVIGGQSVRL